MKQLKLETSLTIYDSIDEIDSVVQEVLHKAQQARKTAYAPYSEFAVGAAIELENGEIVLGSNQENASYPSGLCAERTALYYVGAKFPDVLIKRIAISAGSVNSINERPIPPCGACRQAIAEYEIKQKQPIEIYFMGEKGKVVKSDSLENLLPLIFDHSFLEK